MHIDLNSCFATVEQQSRPSLRGRPVGITNRISPNCCIIAASIEAKARGVKVGSGRREALQVCPDLIIVETDPPKIYWAYRNLLKIMSGYAPNFQMKSIDEGLIDFHNCKLRTCKNCRLGACNCLQDIGYEIKQQLKDTLGCWMRCNIGIGPNRFWAKMAAGLHKPDGLDVVDYKNLEAVLATLELTDLTGIARKLERRLLQCGIASPLEFLAADRQLLAQVFASKVHARHWYERLRGYEVDDFQTHQGQVGRQFVLDYPSNDDEFLLSRLQYLSQTASMKLRAGGLKARGVYVWATLQNGGRWHAARKFPTAAYTDQEIFRRASELFGTRPRRTVTAIGVTCYGLEKSQARQLTFDELKLKDQKLSSAIDGVNVRYGNFALTYANALVGKKVIKQKIPFGSTKFLDLLIGGQ
jgi:DNA polymerase-4